MNPNTAFSKGSWIQLNARRAARTGLLLLLTLPAAVQAQFYYSNNGDGTATITGYSGPGGAVTIPDTTNGLTVTSIANGAFGGLFGGTYSLTSVTMGDHVRSIGSFAFYLCTNLTSVTVPESLTSIGSWTFTACKLTSFTIPKNVSSVGAGAFNDCASLTAITVDTNNPFYSSTDGVLFYGSQTFLVECPGSKEGAYSIPNSVTSIVPMGFFCCKRLTSVTIPNGLAYLGQDAFSHCFSLTGVYFKGNAPTLGGMPVFALTTNVTVYYLPGTTGWGPTFGDHPTAVWMLQAPTIPIPPRTQTAEIGSAAHFSVYAVGSPLLTYQWFFNDSVPVGPLTTNSDWEVSSAQPTQAGAYTVVVANDGGLVTSAPAMLSVITPVERRPVPGVQVTGQTGSLLNVDYADSLSPAPSWTTLGSVSLASTSQYYCDLILPLPPQRFYRAWQTGTPAVIPSLDLHMVPAITLTGSIGTSLRLDYINQFGPTDAWVTLDTVTLTNTSQLYFDVSAPGQPQRLYRLVPLP